MKVICLVFLVSAVIVCGASRSRHEADDRKWRSKIGHVEDLRKQLFRARSLKSKLESRVDCQLNECRKGNDVITDQLIGLINEKNIAQAQLIRLAGKIKQLECTLQRFDSAVKKCLSQVSLVNATRLGDGVYYFYNDLNNLKNKFEAFVFCRTLGMNVVTIETEAENDLLKGKVNEFYDQDPTTDKFFWISLNDLGQEGTYVWSGSGKPMTFSDWAPGSPDGGTAENCVQMVRRAGKTNWDDVSCITKGRVICEMDQPCAGLIKNLVI